MPSYIRVAISAAVLVAANPAWAEADDPTPEREPAPAPAAVFVGDARVHESFELSPFEGVSVTTPSSVSFRLETTSSFAVDRDQTLQPGGLLLSPRARLALRIDTQKSLAPLNLFAEYEHDLPTMLVGTEPALAGAGMPNARQVTHQLRKAYLRVALGHTLQLSGGFMTSHWGLGLLANDGAHGWEPGSARFADPRGGDRVLRGMVSTGPHGEYSAVLAAAGDWVYDDDALLTSEELRSAGGSGAAGDQAFQFVVAGKVSAESNGAGIYIVRRDQKTADGRTLSVTVGDLTGQLTFDLADFGELRVEAEVAYVVGDTDYTSTPETPRQTVQQVGAAARASWSLGFTGVVIDVLWATGDQNMDDGRQNAFRADPNYEMGLLLFRHLLAAQTGRAVYSASRPDIVGRGSVGLERLPTRGSPTNTIAFFPRGWWRPLPGLEAYGGPLLAFAEVPLADPFNTRLAGGAARNALDGSSGSLLGVEIDLGVRYRALLWGTQLTVGLEGAVLIPGDAFTAAGGDSMDPIFGGRIMLDYGI